MTEIPELTDDQFARALPAGLRKRLMLGQFSSGEDISALRRFVGLTQAQFALAMGISVHTLRNWEQGRRHPEGPAVALLRIAARHPRIIRENGGAANFSVRVPEVDKMLDQALTELNVDKRNQIWGEIDKRVMEEAVIYPGVYAKLLLVRSKNAANIFVSDAWGGYDYLGISAQK